MSGIGRYIRQEKRIAASDTGGILERWRWGLRLLADTTRVTKNGNLKHGVLGQLAKGTTSSGYQLDEREIQRRLACARAYPTEAQIRPAMVAFGSWSALRDAGFPPIQAPPGAPVGDYRDPDERARDSARLLAELAGDQLTLFPDDTFGPTSTLAELAGYAEDMRELTARFAHRDAERDAYLKQLLEAVGGDVSATWETAEHALRNVPPDPVL